MTRLPWPSARPESSVPVLAGSFASCDLVFPSIHLVRMDTSHGQGGWAPDSARRDIAASPAPTGPAPMTRKNAAPASVRGRTAPPVRRLRALPRGSSGSPPKPRSPRIAPKAHRRSARPPRTRLRCPPSRRCPRPRRRCDHPRRRSDPRPRRPSHRCAPKGHRPRKGRSNDPRPDHTPGPYRAMIRKPASHPRPASDSRSRPPHAQIARGVRPKAFRLPKAEPARSGSAGIRHPTNPDRQPIPIPSQARPVSGRVPACP